MPPITGLPVRGGVLPIAGGLENYRWRSSGSVASAGLVAGVLAPVLAVVVR